MFAGHFPVTSALGNRREDSGCHELLQSIQFCRGPQQIDWQYARNRPICRPQFGNHTPPKQFIQASRKAVRISNFGQAYLRERNSWTKDINSKSAETHRDFR
jgi:hypothetical protein